MEIIECTETIRKNVRTFMTDLKPTALLNPSSAEHITSSLIGRLDLISARSLSSTNKIFMLVKVSFLNDKYINVDLLSFASDLRLRDSRGASTVPRRTELSHNEAQEITQFTTIHFLMFVRNLLLYLPIYWPLSTVYYYNQT